MKILLLGSFCATMLQATTWYITVAGLGGEPEYETRFTSLAMELDKSVRSTPNVKVTTLTGSVATKARIEAVIDEAVKGPRPMMCWSLRSLGMEPSTGKIISSIFPDRI